MRTRSTLGFSKYMILPALTAIVAAACGGGTDGTVLGQGAGNSSGNTSSGAGGNTSSSTSTSTSSTSTSTSTSTSSSGSMTCKGDADCKIDPAKAVCDVKSGACVGCVPGGTACAAGQWCNPGTEACEVGCTTGSDCKGGNNLTCDPATHKCVGCTADGDCPPGSICASNSCLPGCNAGHDCQAGSTCCSAQCFDLQTDVLNCGACDNLCTVPANSSAVCNSGACGMGACNGAFADCNVDIADGCEQNTLNDGPCVCTPGDTQPCYDGAPNTENIGPCKGGTQTCDPSGLSWGACAGEVLPVAEICANAVDDDCNGTVDDVIDADKDGWTTCNGDCDDSQAVVNPGAYEVVGDGIDNDCDPASSDIVPVADCATQQKLGNINGLVTGTDMAKAIDLCQFTTLNAVPKKWGVLTADTALANSVVAAGQSATDIQTWQAAVLADYGNIIKPKKGATFGGISSGRMRDANDNGFVVPVGGSTFSSSIAFPGAGALATYVGAHGGALLPGKCGAMTCPVGSGANDSVNIKLSIRVPTNAKSMSYDFRFFSGEYQSFQCTAFNDYYLAMLKSNAPGIPVDHNISFDALNNPVSVNNGFFQVCGGNGKGCGNCPAGTGELAGTGMDQVSGGGTTWLTTDAPVVPGETITIEFIVFDVSDHIYDSLTILDNFRWSLSAAVVGTHM